MSREIKFRVWHTNTGRHYYQFSKFSFFGYESSDGGAAISYIGRTDGNLHPAKNGNFVSVRDEKELVWEQYTGLKDKNGKEIYEGDIVKVWQPSNEKRDSNNPLPKDFWFSCIEIAPIVWLDGGFVCDFTRLRYDDFDPLMATPHRYEILGNIHENPELLK